MAYASRPMGNCYKCGSPINIGQRFSHDRHTAGRRFHTDCGIVAAGGKAVILPTGTSSPVIKPRAAGWPSAPVAADDLVPALQASVAAVKAKKKPTGWAEVLGQLMEAGATRGLLVGPPGTGKSTTAADGYKFRITCHEDMGPEALVGTFIQKEGATVWIDGPAVKAMKLGTRLVLDEIDHTSPECMSILYALLDDKPSIMLPTGEYVEAVLGADRDGYTVIATSNGNPGDLPDAILDRLEFVILADKPHDAAGEKLKTLAAGSGKAAAILATMNNHYRSASDKSAWAWRGTPTLRRMLAFSRFLSAGINDKIAAEAVFGNAAAEILSVMATAGK